LTSCTAPTYNYVNSNEDDLYSTFVSSQSDDNLEELCVDELEEIFKEVSDNSTSCSIQTMPNPTTSTSQSSKTVQLNVKSALVDEQLSVEALRYVAGFVAFKYKKDYPQLGVVTSKASVVPNKDHDWLRTLSRGGLREPTDDWLKVTQCLESDFKEFHGNGLSQKPNVVKDLAHSLSAKYPSSPAIAIQYFLKLISRTIIIMRQISSQMTDKNVLLKKNN